MHASSSRLLTIRPLAKATVDSASIVLPPAITDKARRAAAATGAAEETSSSAPLKARKQLASETAGQLLLQREQALRKADGQRAAAAALNAGEDASNTLLATPGTAAAIASSWPTNLRIEPEIHKRDLYWKVPSEQREQLRKMLKERR